MYIFRMSFEFLNPRSAQAVLDRLVALRFAVENQLALALIVVAVIIHHGAGAP